MDNAIQVEVEVVYWWVLLLLRFYFLARHSHLVLMVGQLVI